MHHLKVLIENKTFYNVFDMKNNITFKAVDPFLQQKYFTKKQIPLLFKETLLLK